MSSAPMDPDTWIEEFANFLTSSVDLPSTARAVYMTGVPSSYNNASIAAFFSSFYTNMLDAAGEAQPNAAALINITTYTNSASTSSSRTTIIAKSEFPITTASHTVYPAASPTVSPSVSLTASASPECNSQM